MEKHKEHECYNPTIRDHNIEPLYNLMKFENGVPEKDIEEMDDELLEYLGVYFESKGCMSEMLKYSRMAIKKGNIRVMYNLGYYYDKVGDIENMLKYYLMAVENGDGDAMNNLGYYYNKVGDIENMLKYYLMAVEKGDSDTMYNLGSYYYKIGDIDGMLKYYLLAIEKGEDCAMNNLGYYYEKIGDVDNMLRYYLMAIKLNNPVSKSNLSIYLESHISKNIEWIIKNMEYMEPIIIKLTNKYMATNDTPYKSTTKVSECCICYYTTNMALLKCKHDVCFDCVTKIDKCPLCRIDL